jgi:hypothetical protein
MEDRSTSTTDLEPLLGHSTEKASSSDGVPNCSKALFVVTYVAIALFLFTSIIIMYLTQDGLSLPIYEIVYDRDGGIILVGDSLISRAVNSNKFIEKLKSQVNGTYGITSVAFEGFSIMNIRQQIPLYIHQVLHHSSISTTPTFVCMLWDSDVSDTDFTQLGS